MKFEVQDASPTIATELNLVTGEQVYYIKRLRFIGDNAAQLEETWMSVARFPDLTVSHMQKSNFHILRMNAGSKSLAPLKLSPTFPYPRNRQYFTDRLTGSHAQNSDPGCGR